MEYLPLLTGVLGPGLGLESLLTALEKRHYTRHKKIPNKRMSSSAFIFQPDKSWKYRTVWLNTGQVATLLKNRDHSFPQNAEFWAKPRNLPISAEFLCFHRILRNSVLDSDKGTNMAYFDGVRATILYVYMISPWNTWLPLGLWLEEYWKYQAELIWNTDS